MKYYQPDPIADILAFRGTWRKYITWLLPSDDQLRRLMYSWCPRYDQQLKRGLRITADRFNRSGSFEEIVKHATAIMIALWNEDNKVAEAQRKAQLHAERLAKAAAKAQQAEQAAQWRKQNEEMQRRAAEQRQRQQQQQQPKPQPKYRPLTVEEYVHSQCEDAFATIGEEIEF